MNTQLTTINHSLTEAMEILSFLPGGSRHGQPFGEEMTMERSLEELRELIEQAQGAIDQDQLQKVELA